jgi:O-antigen ligase
MKAMITQVGQSPSRTHLETFGYVSLMAILVTAGIRESWLQITSLMACFFVLIWYGLNRRIWQFKAEWRLIHYCAASFALYFLVHLISLDQAAALPRLDGPSRALIFAPLLALPWIAKASWSRIRQGIVISGLLLGFSSLLNVIWFHPGGRNFGFFTYHNLFGYSAMTILGILACTLDRNTRQGLAWLSMTCCLLATIASGTRGALVALPIIALVILIKYRLSLRGHMGKSVGLSILLAVLVYLVFPMIESRYQASVNEITQATVHNNYTTSIGQRLAMWQICWELILDRPLMGHGLSLFPGAMQPWADRLGIPVRFEYGGFQNPHNLYLGWAATMGIPSMLVLLVLIAGIPIWIARKLTLMNPTPERQQAFTALLVLYTLLAVFCLTESVIERQRGTAWFVIFICLIIGSMMGDSKPDRQTDSPEKVT